MEFVLEEITDAELARRRALYEPFTESIRELVDAAIRTEVDESTLHEAHRMIDAAVELLRAKQLDGAFGVRFTPELEGMPWGNAAIGIRNALAPPLRTRRLADGSIAVDFALGAAYEGPPGHVHGGICAMVLDHVLGEAASADDAPTYTGTLSVRYLRPTPLGALRAQAAIEERDGRKKIVRGAIYDDEGPTATAEGIFIEPRNWSGTMPEAGTAAPAPTGHETDEPKEG